MKKRSMGSVVAVLLVGLLVVACAGPSKEVQTGGGLAVVVGTPLVEISKTARVVLYGTGFEPKQEIRFLFKDASGVQSDIGNALKPEPVPNEVGAWVTAWNCAEYVSLLKPGTFTLTVTDKDYKTLAQVPVAFFAVEKKKEEKKDVKKEEKKEEKKEKKEKK